MSLDRSFETEWTDNAIAGSHKSVNPPRRSPKHEFRNLPGVDIRAARKDPESVGKLSAFKEGIEPAGKRGHMSVTNRHLAHLFKKFE